MSESAIKWTEALTARLGVPPMLRVRVIGGGTYGLTWEVRIGNVGDRDGDRKRTNSGVEVFVDGISAQYLTGAEIGLDTPVVSGLRPPMPGGPHDQELRVIKLPAELVSDDGESFAP